MLKSYLYIKHVKFDVIKSFLSYCRNLCFLQFWFKFLLFDMQELEEKRKARSQEVYQRKKQLNRLRVKAEKAAEEKLGAQLDILAPVKYWT